MLMPSIFGEDPFDGWMRDPWSDFYRENGKKTSSLMKTDIQEKDGNYVLDMELPGYKKEDVSAKLENGYLTIQATHSEDKDEKDKNGNFIRKERYSGSCSRSFYLGENVRQEDITAKFENGILSLTFPKETARKIPENQFISIEG